MQFCRQLIQSAALVVGNCLSDNVDLYMQLHPETDITGAFTSYFNYPNSIVRLVCKLTYHQFSYYLHPGSIDCPDTISYYAQLLLISSESKLFIVREEKLFLDATDLLKVLQCLCTSTNNRRAIVTNHEFHKAITNLLLREGKKEIECALNLLLTYLTEGQPIVKTDLEQEKRKKGEVQISGLPKEDSREHAREELLCYFPEIVHQLESVLASPCGAAENLKKLCSAMLWRIKANPG